MQLNVTNEGERARFQIGGNVDEKGAEDLKQSFRGLNISSLKEAVFDFREVNYIGSAGIGKLLLFYKDMAVNGGKIRIENPSEPIYELLSVLKLDSLFSISKA